MTKRRKGERKDGLIQRSAILHLPDGQKIRKYVYGHTALEADEKLKLMIKSTMQPTAKKPSMTVSEWADIWYKTYIVGLKRARPLSESSTAGYRSRIAQLKASIGAMKLSDVRENHLQNALQSVHGDSQDAISKYMGLMRRMFGKAQSNGLINDNPALYLDTPHGTKGTHRSLTQSEVSLILNNWQKHRAGLWVITMLLTGMRRGELCALKWENIDLTKRKINIVESATIRNSRFSDGQTKSAAGVRSVPICDTLLDALLTVPEPRRNSYLCLDTYNNPLTPTSFRRGWDGFRNAMWRIAHNLPINMMGRKDLNDNMTFDWRPHDLRYTFATAMYDANIPAKAAQYYMGHADIKLTLNLYTSLSDKRERESNDQLVNFLDNFGK